MTFGKSYTSSTPPIAVKETQQTLSFLGRKSQVKQHHVAYRQPIGEELIFMGRHYTR